jgi:hypothetical protein
LFFDSDTDWHRKHGASWTVPVWLLHTPLHSTRCDRLDGQP